MKRVAILMPVYCKDIKKNALTGSGQDFPFVARLRKILEREPSFTLVPLLNGGEPEDMQRLATEKRPFERISIRPMVCGEKGVAAVVRSAYDQILCQVPNYHYVIRMDDAEHPPEAIYEMLWKLQSSPAVLGNLKFGPDMLGQNEMESERQMQIWCEHGMNTYTYISHAHGCQGYDVAVLREIHSRALDIQKKASQILGEKMQWGFDLSMLLATDTKGFPLATVPLKAEIRRDRGGEKNKKQYDAWRAVFQAAYPARRFG